MPGPAS